MISIESILKALADKNRLRILALLSEQKMCVCELAYILGITQPSVSRHLKKLKSATLIADEQDSFWTNYKIASFEDKETQKLFRTVIAMINNAPWREGDLQRVKSANRKKLCCKVKR